jgi:uncharacterized protein YecE (DUF72 family)
MQKKFNYDYSDQELRAWCDSYLPGLAARADQGMLFFNNHVRAQAPRNGKKLAAILAGLQYGER